MNIATSSPKLAWTWLFLLAAPLLGGCGSSLGEEAAEACQVAADAFADSAERCGFDRDTIHDEFIDSAAGGDCDKVIRLRNKELLYTNCIPFLSSVSCEALTDPSFALPASCQEQLLRSLL